MNEIERLQQLAGIQKPVAEAKGDMPSKEHIMKMCKDGKSKKEICDMHPDCDQGKLKAMIDDCMKEMKESVNEAETGDEVSKTVAGHTDDERDMIKKELFQMGTYAVELYKMLDKLPDNVDFPHWWQGKIVKPSEYLSNSKHYLENELNVPEDDNVAVSPEVEDDNDPSGVS